MRLRVRVRVSVSVRVSERDDDDDDGDGERWEQKMGPLVNRGLKTKSIKEGWEAGKMCINFKIHNYLARGTICTCMDG